MGVQTATENVVAVLGRIPLFQGLPTTDLEQIAAVVGRRELHAGEFLFREGDPDDRLYVVHDGAVEILRERPLGDHERLAVKRGGEAFGERSLLDEGPRSASVRAVEESRLLSLSRTDFLQLLGGDSISVRLMRGMARTLRDRDIRFTAREGAGGRDNLRQFGRLVLGGLEPKTVPQAEGFRIGAGTARDEAIGGGSLWDGFTTDDGRVLLTLMDVKGSGLPPAYLIGVGRALFREIAARETFDRLLTSLNAATFRNLFEGLDECVETAALELRDGEARWSCAGDQPGFMLRGGGGTEEATTHGPPLGILPQFDYGATILDLQPGDTFITFSEAPAGMLQGAVELVRNHGDAEPAELVRLLRAALQKVQARGAETDVAFLVVRKT